MGFELAYLEKKIGQEKEVAKKWRMKATQIRADWQREQKIRIELEGDVFDLEIEKENAQSEIKAQEDIISVLLKEKEGLQNKLESKSEGKFLKIM